MKTIFDRTRMLIGTDGLNIVKSRNIIVFGVGGVGGFVIEALVRAGIGKIAIVDFDLVDITNINRQIIALHSTIGRNKTEVMAERLKDINPCAEVTVFTEKLNCENVDGFHLENYDYIVDAIDDVQAKLLLIKSAKELNVPIICSMGTGNKFDPSQFRIADLRRTHTCPLAKIIRKEVGKLGIKNIKVIFSTETPHREELPEDGSKAPSSISFVPASAGLLIASEVIKDLLLSEPGDRYLFGIKLKPPTIKADY